MAVDSNIGSLPAVEALDDDSLLVAEQQGEAKHFTGKQLKDYAKEGVAALVAAAQKAADDAAQAARDAKAAADSVQDVSADAAAAKAAAQAATQAMVAAQNARDAARTAAETAAGDAAAKAAQSVENKLAGYVTDAENAKSAAQSAAGTAATDAANAVNSQLAQHVADAQAAQRAAEQARNEAQAIAGGDFLPLAGGTLNGALTLHGDPTEPMHAVSKQYVDEKLKDADFDVTADEVTFADGETFQQKYDNGELTGKSGVYVGSGEMPEGYNVQIDPDGELEPFPSAFVLDTLPKASEALRGSFVIVPDGDTDNLYICMRVGGVYGWIVFNTSDTGGGSEDDAATTSVLGQATLGTMILGR